MGSESFFQALDIFPQFSNSPTDEILDHPVADQESCLLQHSWRRADLYRVDSTVHHSAPPPSTQTSLTVSIAGAATTGGQQRPPNRWVLPLAPRPTPTGRARGGGCFFMFVIVFFMILAYVGYVTTILPSAVFYEDELEPDRWSESIRIRWYGAAYAIVWHFLFSMLVTSFCKASKTDPGGVPPNWGFYMGDEIKRRRYCKMCNVWKPDRTHHCSACGRCVLNMDHHCPWVKNCIGYQNRKFFIQLLTYTILCSSCVVVHGVFFFMDYGRRLVEGSVWDSLRFMLAVLVILASVFVLFPLFPFTRYHYQLVARNSTTIEDLEGIHMRGRYDLGLSRNVEQVLGSNVLLWWFPGHTVSSRPVGDGVRWNQNYLRAIEASD